MIAVLLLVFGLTPAYIFPVNADFPVHPNFDFAKIVGKWHGIGVATMLPEMSESEKETFPMDHTLQAEEDGLLRYITSYPIDLDYGDHREHGCQPVTFLLWPTNKTAVFDGFGGLIHIMDIDYEKYYIFYVKRTSSDTMVLSARESEVGDDIKEKFKQLALGQGFPKGNIKYFENVEKCTPKYADA